MLSTQGLSTSQLPSIGDTTHAQVAMAHAPVGANVLLAFTDDQNTGIETALMDPGTGMLRTASLSRPFVAAELAYLSAAASGDTFLLAFADSAQQIQLMSVDSTGSSTSRGQLPGLVNDVAVAGGTSTYLVCWIPQADGSVWCEFRAPDGSLLPSSTAFVVSRTSDPSINSISVAFANGSYAVAYHHTADLGLGMTFVAEGNQLSVRPDGTFATGYSDVVIAGRDQDFEYVALRGSGFVLDGGTATADGSVISVPTVLWSSTDAGRSMLAPSLHCLGSSCMSCWYETGAPAQVVCGDLQSFSRTTVYYPAAATIPYKPAVLWVQAGPFVVLPPAGSAP
jgi:hypothetical protein